MAASPVGSDDEMMHKMANMYKDCKDIAEGSFMDSGQIAKQKATWIGSNWIDKYFEDRNIEDTRYINRIWIYRYMDRQLYGQIAIWIDRYMNRQIHGYSYMYRYECSYMNIYLSEKKLIKSFQFL